jgi:hypothetical protein
MQHVRDGAAATGDLPPLLSHLRARWGEGHAESAAVVGVCKAVEMAASGILVSLRDAGAIAEGLDVRARARTPMIHATFGKSHHEEEEEEDRQGFVAAAEVVAERQAMESMGLAPDHDSPTARGSPGASPSVGIVRR